MKLRCGPWKPCCGLSQHPGAFSSAVMFSQTSDAAVSAPAREPRTG